MMMKENKSIIARNEKLNAENTARYFLAFPVLWRVYSLKVIRLASEEMIVPQPPILTPMSSSR